MKKVLYIFLVFIIVLSGCSSNEDIPIYEQKLQEINEKTQEDKRDTTISETDYFDSGEADSVSQEQDKYDITLTVSAYGRPDIILYHAKEFMRLHPDIQIIVNDYSASNGDIEDAYYKYAARLSTDLMSGTADDIIDMTYATSYKYAESDLLCSFSDFMKDDPDFDYNDYYAKIFEALEYKGQLYVLPSGFTYFVLSPNVKMGQQINLDWDQYESLNYEQIMDIYRQMIQSNVENANTIYLWYFIKKGSLMEFENTLFYDVETKTSTYNSAEFVSLLKSTKELEIDGDRGAVSLSIGRPKLDYSKYLFNYYLLNCSTYIVDYINGSGDLAEPVPIVRSDGACPFMVTNAFAISKTSKHPELAWEFLKFCISEKESQEISNCIDDGILDIYPIPVNRNNFEKTFKINGEKSIQNEQYYTSLNLEEETNLGQLFEQINNWTQLEQCYYSADYELLDEIAEILENYYYFDLASAEETAELVHQKVNLYLNE